MRAQLGCRSGLVVLLAVVASATLQVQAPADGKGRITVDKVEFKGWKNNLRLSNGEAELIVTLDVGPRVISYRLADGKNVFKEYADQLGKSGEADWQIRGGHRLWLAPEDLTRTYAPDNGPVEFREVGSGAVRVTPAPETEYGIQKELDLELGASGGGVKVVHRIKNIGEQPARLAPWALSVMAPGGVEIIPLPAKKPHPGPPKKARSPKEYWPNQVMATWPFFDFKDPRWTFGTRYVLLRQDATRGPTKIGLSHRAGWVGYLNQGTLFVKRFGYDEEATYPDGGCNFETFSNEDMLEVESLGPLVEMGPGKSAEWTEQWDLVGGVADVTDDASVDANVVPKIRRE